MYINKNYNVCSFLILSLHVARRRLGVFSGKL